MTNRFPPSLPREEEAAWWDAHREVLADRIRSARHDGRLRHLSETDLPGASETVMIRIPPVPLKRR